MVEDFAVGQVWPPGRQQKNECKIIFDIVSKYKAVRRVSVRDLTTILVDFEEQLDAWGQWPELNSSGYQVTAFDTSNPGNGNKSRMWIERIK